MVSYAKAGGQIYIGQERFEEFKAAFNSSSANRAAFEGYPKRALRKNFKLLRMYDDVLMKAKGLWERTLIQLSTAFGRTRSELHANN
jgi:hypothetical protein